MSQNAQEQQSGTEPSLVSLTPLFFPTISGQDVCCEKGLLKISSTVSSTAGEDATRGLSNGIKQEWSFSFLQRATPLVFGKKPKIRDGDVVTADTTRWFTNHGWRRGTFTLVLNTEVWRTNAPSVGPSWNFTITNHERRINIHSHVGTCFPNTSTIATGCPLSSRRRAQ